MAWPNQRRACLILTHDVDTAFGFQYIKAVCDVERKIGFKSSWHIVPNLYHIEQDTLTYLRQAGMEIAVHDWNHDGRLFAARTIFQERIQKINGVIKEWGATGFRAGMAMKNDEWMSELRCEYDSSDYDTDPYQPLGGGCRLIEPFMLDHLVELPYTMPQDHTLFVAEASLKIPGLDKFVSLNGDNMLPWILNYMQRKGKKNLTENASSVYPPTSLQGMDLWKLKATWLMEKGGMILMLTHPDYLCHQSIQKRWEEKGSGWLNDNDPDVQQVRYEGIIDKRWQGSLLEQYAAFLNWFKRKYDGLYWHVLPRELAHWYKANQISGARP